MRAAAMPDACFAAAAARIPLPSRAAAAPTLHAIRGGAKHGPYRSPGAANFLHSPARISPGRSSSAEAPTVWLRTITTSRLTSGRKGRATTPGGRRRRTSPSTIA